MKQFLVLALVALIVSAMCLTGVVSATVTQAPIVTKTTTVFLAYLNDPKITAVTGPVKQGQPKTFSFEASVTQVQVTMVVTTTKSVGHAAVVSTTYTNKVIGQCAYSWVLLGSPYSPHNAPMTATVDKNVYPSLSSRSGAWENFALSGAQTKTLAVGTHTITVKEPATDFGPCTGTFTFTVTK